MGQGSVVSIATCYGLDGPWIKFGSANLLYSGYRVSFPVHGIDHPPPSSATVKERVGLYLFSTCGPS
jgi:hypothetical protein